jgi:hypothetical protein
MKHGQSDGKRLCRNRVDDGLHFVVFDDFEFFRRNVSDLLFIHSFLEVSRLIGPGKVNCELDLSCFIDKNIVGPDIANFSVNERKIFGGADQSVKQVPHFLF